eukprot:11965703-Alexandrium_andersonii.AAC.1
MADGPPRGRRGPVGKQGIDLDLPAPLSGGRQCAAPAVHWRSPAPGWPPAAGSAPHLGVHPG